MTEAKLKPCAHCGKDEAYRYTSPFVRGVIFHAIRCGWCGAQAGSRDNRAEAIAAWNRRTPAVSREEMEKRVLEEVREAVRGYETIHLGAAGNYDAGSRHMACQIIAHLNERIASLLLQESKP